MRLRDVSYEECQIVRLWRNESIDHYRTPYYLTEFMQDDFYANTICNRFGNSRFYAVDSGGFVGMVGLVGIQWENRLAEISIVIDPNKRGRGVGRESIDKLLQEGFLRLNLENIFAEVYLCNDALKFWEKIGEGKASFHHLPYRKYLNGNYYGSYYINFNRGNYVNT